MGENADEADGATDAPQEESSPSEPLEDLRRDVERRAGDDGAGPGVEAEVDPFTEMSVGDVDADAVWADLLGEADVDPESVDAGDLAAGVEGRFQIVNKGLCHRCRYFGDPPRLHCTHEGTQIHELEDMDHYRVSACPMVETDDATNG